MRDFPSCFSENGVQVADASCSSVGLSKPSQNSVTCLYRCILFDRPCLISVLWSKSMMGHCLSIEIEDASSSPQCMCKVEVKPSWFSKRKGSKRFDVNSHKIEVFWDLSSAKFGSGPEPLEGYYVAIMYKEEIVLLIGDMKKEAFKKTRSTASLSGAVIVSKREHSFGKRAFETKSRLSDHGKIHDLKIEFDTSSDDNPCLVIRVDTKMVMRVKNLLWNFRGNETIAIDGLTVEFLWDVHNWLFRTSLGNATFLFRTSCVSVDYESSVSSWDRKESVREAKSPGFGFSLFLHAWKNE